MTTARATKIKPVILATTALAAGLAAVPAQAQEQDQESVFIMEEIVVTAQRRAESLQDVPLAVTAFDGDALDRFQIENAGDLQFQTPNVTFSKTNFTSTNFQIRGVGSALVAGSGDNGVGIHINDVPLNAPRLFETEYFDVERIEVLRGPQGTLFGRNATGGVVNLITKKASTEFEAQAEGEYGNFDSIKLKGMVNVPLGDEFGGFRVAAVYVNRDGYTDNLFNDTEIDGRDLYSVRGSLRLFPTDRTTVDVVVSYFEEDDNRSRSQKQLCNRDPFGAFGCLPDQLVPGSPNSNGTIDGIVTSSAVLGPLGLFPFLMADPRLNNLVSADLREVFVDFEPVYKADETFVNVEVQHEFEALTATVIGAYQDTSLLSQQDFNQSVANPLSVPPALAVVAPQTFGALFSDGLFPVSAFDDGNTGVVGGNVAFRTDRPLDNYDQSSSDAEQWFVEARVNSNFDGPLNFLFGVNYIDFESEVDYFVASAALDYFATVVFPGQGAALVPPGTPSPLDGLAVVSPFFSSDTQNFTLETFAVFGELYYEFSDQLKLTGGLRWTRDEKNVRDRSLLLDSISTGPGGTPLAVQLGTDDADNTTFINLATMQPGQGSALAPPADVRAAEGLDALGFRNDKVVFEEFTGRVVLDWTPNDNTLVYASYSRGYKGGGFNPPFDPAEFPSAEPTFEPEFINAFEIGTKNQLAGGRLQANLTGFYYDYSGLQISKIVARTSFNENVDAEIYGFESEFLAAPTDNLVLNLAVSYLETSIENASSVDPRDPTNGNANAILIKDLTNASNCIILGASDAAVVQTQIAGALIASGLDPASAAQAAGAFVAFPSPDGRQAFGFCDTILDGDAANGLPPLAALTGGSVFGSSGIEADLNGNALPQSPNWQVSAGAQYTFYFGDDITLTPRIDYYWQDSMFGRIFNRRIDRIDSWDVINAQVTLASDENGWYVRGFVQNLENDDNITGMFVTDASSGLFTNVFTVEPRRYGVVVGVRF